MRSDSEGRGKRYLRSKREGREERPGSSLSRWLVEATMNMPSLFSVE